MNSPKHNEARNAFNSGDFGTAAKLYNEILMGDASSLEAAERLGLIMTKLNNMPIAEKLFKHLIQHHPNDAAAHGNLAGVLNELNKLDEAVAENKIAIKLDAKNITYYLNLAGIYLKVGALDDAVEYYKKAYELDNNNLTAVEALSDITNIQSPVEAFPYLKRLYELNPNDLLKIGVETFVPVFYKSQDEIDKFREGLNERLDKLLTQDLKIDLNKRIYNNSFYLAYHARNNKELKSKLAAVYVKAAPGLLYKAPHVENYKHDKTGKIRIGFISAFFYRHPVSQCFNGTIAEICKDERFEVHILYIPVSSNPATVKQDEYFRKISDAAHATHIFDEKYFNVREYIACLKLDSLVYVDIGMYWMTYLLAFAELAPVQAVLTGHPDTSGIPSIKYYLASDDMEEDGAEDCFSEQLIRLDHINNYIESPKLPEVFKTRAELNLPGDKNIYYCPMKNQKIHPDFDFALKEILEKDKNALILFPTDTGKISEFALERMKENIGAELVKRIMHHPWASSVEFLSYLKTADVVLDTFYFGAGTTINFAFGVDAPIVTLPGLGAGGRLVYAAYKVMGIEDLVASSQPEYVDMAIRCATDKKFQAEVKAKIHEKKKPLFDNPEVAADISNFIFEKVTSFK